MLLGHSQIIKDLIRFADAKRFASGYIFSGPSDVGKQLVALHLANYLENKNPEGSGTLSDMFLIAPDEKGTIGIDAAREIKNFLWQKPLRSPCRLLLINEAEKLTEEAQNAILKITEEPPASSLLILITGDSQKLLPTLRSRLQTIHFGIAPTKEIAVWLAKEYKCPAEKACILAEYSCGRPGLALSLFSDKKTLKNQKNAEEFLKSKGSASRDLIKKMIEKEDFSIKEFLDSVILRLSFDRKKMSFPVWHATLKLRLDSEYYNLNPRLQLENLAHIINK